MGNAPTRAKSERGAGERSSTKTGRLRLKDGRPAAVDPQRNPLRRDPRRKEGQKRDEQPEADQHRHPAGAQRRQVQQDAQAAVVAISVIVLHRRGRRFLGVLEQVRAKVQVLHQPRPQGQKTDQQKNGGPPPHDGEIVRRAPRESQT